MSEIDYEEILKPLDKVVFEEQEPKQQDFKPLKHTWKMDEDGSGEIDSFAGIEVDYHNGPLCTECGYRECHHCTDVYSDTSCAYWIAWNEWLSRKLKAEKKNEEIRIINRYLKELRARCGSSWAHLSLAQESGNTASREHGNMGSIE